MSDCPERDALLGVFLNYKTELAKLPPVERPVSYFHIPVDDARTTATTNLRGGYSPLTSTRDLSSSPQIYNINTTVGSTSYQSLLSPIGRTVTYGPSSSVTYSPPPVSSGYLSSASASYLH